MRLVSEKPSFMGRMFEPVVGIVLDIEIAARMAVVVGELPDQAQPSNTSQSRLIVAVERLIVDPALW